MEYVKCATSIGGTYEESQGNEARPGHQSECRIGEVKITASLSFLFRYICALNVFGSVSRSRRPSSTALIWDKYLNIVGRNLKVKLETSFRNAIMPIHAANSSYPRPTRDNQDDPFTLRRLLLAVVGIDEAVHHVCRKLNDPGVLATSAKPTPLDKVGSLHHTARQTTITPRPLLLQWNGNRQRA